MRLALVGLLLVFVLLLIVSKDDSRGRGAGIRRRCKVSIMY
jgi:hypothetical protein